MLQASLFYWSKGKLIEDKIFQSNSNYVLEHKLTAK